MAALYVAPKPLLRALAVSAEISRLAELTSQFGKAIAEAHSVPNASGVTNAYSPWHGDAVVCMGALASLVGNVAFLQPAQKAILEAVCNATHVPAPVAAAVMCFEFTRHGSTLDYLHSCAELCDGHISRFWTPILETHGFKSLELHHDIGDNMYALGDATTLAKIGHGATKARGTGQGHAVLLFAVESLFLRGIMHGHDEETSEVARVVLVAMEAAVTLAARPHTGTLPGGSMYGEVRGGGVAASSAGGACRAAALLSL